MKPLFSIIHPTARPDKWAAVLAAWFAAADQGSFEYILVCDKRWGFEELPSEPPEETGIFMGDAFGGNAFRAVWNTGRRCYVDAVNIGAQYATGEILLVVADDQFPCDSWDLKLAEVLADSGKEVIEVSTGTPQEHDRGILVMPILTRARYERLGFVLYPAYESMFADNDFCESARKDDQVADARNLMFPHRHPFFDSSIPTDKAYEAQNRPEAYQLGGQILAARRAVSFGDAKRKHVVVCLAGETFSRRWVDSILRTMAWLQGQLDYTVVMGYCSNVYATRTSIAQEAIRPAADYVLWIDDDNPVEPHHIAQLISDLEAIPELDLVCGWCCCHADGYASPFINTSVGLFTDGIKQASFRVDELEKATALQGIDWTGFPLVLMRQSALKAFEMPFAPMPNPKSAYGFDSEDLSFSRRMKEAGLKMAVDPRVKVPHLKLRDSNADLAPATAGISEGEK